MDIPPGTSKWIASFQLKSRRSVTARQKSREMTVGLYLAHLYLRAVALVVIDCLLSRVLF